MKALSIKQPWAWLILHAGKDIENRYWPARLRGLIAIHASSKLDYMEYVVCKAFLAERGLKVELPPHRELVTGAILGTVEIVDCVQYSKSPWFVGKFGFVMKDAKPLPVPIACKGRLGFWDAPNL